MWIPEPAGRIGTDNMTDPRESDNFFEHFQANDSGSVSESNTDGRETDDRSGIEKSTPSESPAHDDGISFAGVFFASMVVCAGAGPFVVAFLGLHFAWMLPMSIMFGAIGWAVGRMLGDRFAICILVVVLTVIIGGFGYVIGFLVAAVANLGAFLTNAAGDPRHVPVGSAAVSTAVAITLLSRFELGGPIAYLKARVWKVVLIGLAYGAILECPTRLFSDTAIDRLDSIAVFCAGSTVLAAWVVGLVALTTGSTKH